MEEAERKKALFFHKCGSKLDCLSWCNQGNCMQCPCASCERCGPAPPKHLIDAAGKAEPAATEPVRHIAPAATAPALRPAQQPTACHGWCMAGAEEDEDVVCRSSKCLACPFCQARKSNEH